MARHEENSPGYPGRHRRTRSSSHAPLPRRRHHRKRRFNVHPQALGTGYDTIMPVLDESDPIPAKTPEEEAAARVARAHRTAQTGMLVCAGLALLIWACIHFDWYFKIYLWFINVWTTFTGNFIRR